MINLHVTTYKNARTTEEEPKCLAARHKRIIKARELPYIFLADGPYVALLIWGNLYSGKPTLLDAWILCHP
jgi:hypothetical protein